MDHAPSSAAGSAVRLPHYTPADQSEILGDDPDPFCRPPLVPLYERLGWHALTADVTVEQPEGAALMPLRTMWTPLRDGAEWPDGAVRLLSYPM
ncbi:hypothetical protein [Streptomyces sp. NPDC026659]|uniref:hypothetical protein n=1 Tax=Streptomyces sp. NPDC026659 TaxID=3155123 RepID=UPI0034067AE0